MKIHNKFKLTIQNYQKTTEKYRECRDITQKLNNIASRTLILLAGKTKQTPLLPRHPMNFTKIKNLKKLELLKDINSIFLFRIKKNQIAREIIHYLKFSCSAVNLYCGRSRGRLFRRAEESSW